MSTQINRQFRTSDGVNAYDPELVASELVFFYLTNVEPRLGRLFSSRGYTQFQSLAATLAGGDQLVGLSFYQLSTRSYVNLYVFSKTSVYWFDFSTALFNVTPIYTGFVSSLDPYVFLPWYDGLYVTKLLSPYVKLQRRTATVIADVPSARYGLVANSHAYLGGVNDGITSQMAQVRWSDLDDPESFAFDAQASEADFFDLEPDSLEITGLSYQRSSVFVYTPNTIWAGSYVGFPGGFRHDPVFPGLGAIFHDCVVRSKEVDYFIGADGIYMLNGLQPVSIGDRIFERFIADVNVEPVGGDPTVSVRGYLDSRKNQVFWVYNSTAQGGMWSIVYNYKEQKWSERDPQGVRGWLDSPRIALRGYDAINNVSTTIDSTTTIIDNPFDGYPIVLPQLMTAGSKVGAVSKTSENRLKLDGTAFAHTIETADFYFDDFIAIKEVNKANLVYTKTGAATPQIQVGIRANQGDAVAWSSAINQSANEGGSSFFFRSAGAGRYIRFRFTWSNADAIYITDVRLLSLTKVENQDVISEK